MKDKISSFQLTLSQYILSFFSIQVLWIVGGNYVTQQLLYVTRSSLHASSPILLYVIQHANFLLLFIILILFIRFVAKSSFLSFISDHSQFSYKGFALGLGVYFIVMILNSFINIVILDSKIVFHDIDDPLIHLFMFMCALLCSPIQALGEEILFRSFFYRAFNTIRMNKYIVASISAIFFTLAHTFNSEFKMEISNFLILLYYFLSGFFFILLVYRYKGIEVALGAHIMNNFYIATIMNYRHSSIISHPLFVIEKTNIYIDLLFLILSSIILLNLPQREKQRNEK